MAVFKSFKSLPWFTLITDFFPHFWSCYNLPFLVCSLTLMKTKSLKWTFKFWTQCLEYGWCCQVMWDVQIRLFPPLIMSSPAVVEENIKPAFLTAFLWCCYLLSCLNLIALTWPGLSNQCLDKGNDNRTYICVCVRARAPTRTHRNINSITPKNLYRERERES